MVEIRIRDAVETDAAAVLAIYAPIVRYTAISFEIEPPTVADMRDRVATTVETYPWLIAESDDRVLGYAYAGQHSQRAAYAWSVDVSVYVDDGARGQGVGGGLYRTLLRLLTAERYVMAFAGIALPNDASVGLHESLGFVPVGVFTDVGYKHGRWHDVGWWQRHLCDPPSEPELPTRWSRKPSG